MTTITCKIPPELDARLQAAAREQHISRSEVVRKALRDALLRKRRTVRPTAWELVKHLAGTVHGPPDLLTNPEHMEDFGK